MTLETPLKTFHNSGIIVSRGSGHSTQKKLVKLTENAWLGAAVEYFGTFPSVRLNVKGNPIAGIIVEQAFPEITDVNKDSDDMIVYTTNPWVNIEPIQKGTVYVITAKTNTAVPLNAEIQFDGGYAVPTALGAIQVTTIQTVADSAGSLNDTYITISLIDAEGDQKDYYVWFNINSAGTDPALPGRTGIEVAGVTNVTANALAASIQTAMDAITGWTATVLTDTVTVNNDNKGECQNVLDGNGAAATGFTLATPTEGSDPGDAIASPTSVGGINTITAVTATGATEKLFKMEGR